MCVPEAYVLLRHTSRACLQKPFVISIFLCGDVMTGRGIDQALPSPSDPALYESCVHNAREYVALAEDAHGPIQRPISFKRIWGDALPELAGADLRIINLETGITASDEPWPGKGIHYRMNPLNIGCLNVAGISACALANNHVLDWGRAGLLETIETLDRVGIGHAGAGGNQEEAFAPAVLETPGKGRALLFSLGSITSGIPEKWSATDDRSGVNLANDLSAAAASRIAGRMRQFQQPGDLIIASVHWGSNWGSHVPSEQKAFAHRLVEQGVALVHGHSSHHVKTIELYQNRIILYGCGDFITDYEGITGYETFRNDLALMYFLQLDGPTGQCLSARLVPMQMRRFRLQRASSSDSQWLCALLNRLGSPSGTHLKLAEDDSILLG